MQTNFDLEIVTKRQDGVSYEYYCEERRASNKSLKRYLRGVFEHKGDRSTRFNINRQLEKYLRNGWSELAPNEKKFLELWSEYNKNEGRKDTYRDNIPSSGVGSIDLQAPDAEPMAGEQVS